MPRCLLPICLLLLCTLSSQLLAAVNLSKCLLRSPSVPASITARCGSLSVVENPADSDSKRINLHIAIVPAKAAKVLKDPVVLLAGGPGQAASESYPILAQALAAVNRQRDILLVDQRGTGQSNRMDCTQDNSMSLLRPSDTEVLSQVKECLKQLPGDPRFYATPYAVDDLEQVRQRLGYSKLNLYGVSYGSRVAFAYLRKYPNNVRTATLDGVVPADQLLGKQTAINMQHVLGLQLSRCSANPQCKTNYPDLKEGLRKAFYFLQKNPQKLSVRHPRTGKATEVSVDGDMLAQTVRLLSYSPETVTLLPLFIKQTIDGDYQAVAAQALMIFDSLKNQFAAGMALSVSCSEDAPFYAFEFSNDKKNKDGQAKSNGFLLLGDTIEKNIRLQCSIWPKAELSDSFKQMVRSDLPVLLLSGEYDPVTPPAWAERVRKHLPNSKHLIAPGQGHNVLPRGCIAAIYTDFVEHASTAELETKCLENLGPLPFFLNSGGPAP